MTDRVLVTGGSGFIGSEVIKFLNGYDIHLIGRSGHAPSGTTGHCLDLVADDPLPLLRRLSPTHLLHLAWSVPPGRFWSAAENLDWVAASLRLTRAFATAGGKRAVFAGSCAEYDWGEETLSESITPLRPHSLYGQSKAALFEMLAKASPELGLSVGWGRIFFPYGPFEKPNRLFSSVVDGLSSGTEVLCSEGLQVRDFMHAADCGKAFAALLDSDVEGAVNIASGDPRSVREFVETTAECVGNISLLRIGARPLQAGEPEVMLPSSSRLYDEVGFRPRWGFRDGIKDAVMRRMERNKQ